MAPSAAVKRARICRSAISTTPLRVAMPSCARAIDANVLLAWLTVQSTSINATPSAHQSSARASNDPSRPATTKAPCHGAAVVTLFVHYSPQSARMPAMSAGGVGLSSSVLVKVVGDGGQHEGSSAIQICSGTSGFATISKEHAYDRP